MDREGRNGYELLEESRDCQSRHWYVQTTLPTPATSRRSKGKLTVKGWYQWRHTSMNSVSEECQFNVGNRNLVFILLSVIDRSGIFALRPKPKLRQICYRSFCRIPKLLLTPKLWYLAEAVVFLAEASVILLSKLLYFCRSFGYFAEASVILLYFWLNRSFCFNRIIRNFAEAASAEALAEALAEAGFGRSLHIIHLDRFSNILKIHFPPCFGG